MSNGEVDKVDEESVRTMKLKSDKRHWSYDVSIPGLTAALFFTSSLRYK